MPRAAPPGLISQVAEELWEVKDRKIKNLTKEDITIVDYKKLLVKNSAWPPPLLCCVPSRRLVLTVPCAPPSAGMAALEKAKLFSKSTGKTKT